MALIKHMAMSLVRETMNAALKCGAKTRQTRSRLPPTLHPPDHAVNLKRFASGPRNPLRDERTANTGIAALEFDDRVDEFLR